MFFFFGFPFPFVDESNALESLSLFIRLFSSSLLISLTSCSARSGTRASATRSAGEDMQAKSREREERRRCSDFDGGDDEEKKVAPFFAGAEALSVLFQSFPRAEVVEKKY